jgi:hypothetical protein
MSNVHSVWAGPMFFGPWTTIVNQISGPLIYDVSATPLGDTDIRGEIRYWDFFGAAREEVFFDSVKIRTDNSTQAIDVRFRGDSFGSEVRVIVS